VHFAISSYDVWSAKAFIVKGAGAEDGLWQKVVLAIRNNIFIVVTVHGGELSCII
jgi:hypothetical protein